MIIFNKKFKATFTLASILISISMILSGSSFAKESIGEVYESKLMRVVETVEQGNLDQALPMVDALLNEYPKSRIGALIKADILSAMAGDLTNFGDGIQDKLIRTNFSHELNLRATWRNESNLPRKDEMIPASILDMGQDKYVFVGEASTGRFFIFGNNNGVPYLVKDYYMTIGTAGFGKQVEGDNKTPIGLYSVTREIDGKTLPDLYGSGAFPVDYPNKVDRWRKRTGYGIWLHGTPSDTYSRAPLASQGCFVLSNDDYDEVATFLRQVEKPRVLLLEKVKWFSQEEHKKQRQEYLKVMQEWVAGWESLDIDRYLSFYDRDNLNFGKLDFTPWSKRKKAINQRKKFIQLSLGLQSMYIYPGEKDMFAVDFKQNYLSDNYKGISDKTIYWKKSSEGQWKIIYEGDRA